MREKLTPEQQRRIDFFLEDGWVHLDDDEEGDDEISAANLSRLLKEIEVPEEIHLMIAGFNWDGGGDEISLLIDHSKCDVASVLLAYWRSGPRYFCQYSSEEEIRKYQRESWLLVQRLHAAVVDRLGDDSSIGFDPRCDDTFNEYDWTADYAENEVEGGLYAIPEAFFRPIVQSGN
ncbi:MAG: DUF4274 domain-containing protein [Acidobacteriota bacterium]